MACRTVVVAILVLCLATASPVGAQPTDDGHGGPGAIEGRVTTTAGDPLVGVSVRVQPSTACCGPIAVTGSDGSYAFADLAPDVYTVTFQSGEVGDRVYEDLYEAYRVSLASDETRSGLDATLRAYPRASGRVTDAFGDPVSGVEVFLETRGSGPAVTGADGTWVKNDVEPGMTTLYFRPQYTHYDQWWDGAAELVDATEVEFGWDEDVSGFDATLSRRSTLGGTVRSETGVPIYGASVTLTRTDGSDNDYDQAGLDGSFQFDAVEAATYTLRFEASGYATEYHDNAADEASATIITVGRDEELLIDAELSATTNSSLSGTVTNSTEEPVAGLDVWAYGDAGTRRTQTDATGGYQLANMEPGTWDLMFDKAGFRSQEPAVTIGVDAQIVLDVVMVRPGTIGGVVTDAAGNPVAEITVAATRAADGRTLGFARTGADGSYELSVNGEGDMIVQFTPIWRNDLIGQYYDNAAERADAAVVAVGPESTITGIDAQLSAYGRLVGRVTNTAGDPVGGVSVTAYEASGWSRTGFARTDDDGLYSVSVPDGDNHVVFGHASYPAEWFDDSPDRAGAAVVNLAVDEVFTADVEFGEYGSISDRVVADDGTPIEGAGVTVFAVASSSSRWVPTDSDGRWSLEGYIAGTYLASVYTAGHQFEFWDDAPDQASATPIIIGSAEHRTDIDFDLTPLGSISGRVLDQNGDPVDASVYAFAPGDFDAVEIAQTNAEGRYQMFFAESATVELRVISGLAPNVWWDDAADRADATAISIQPFEELTGYDFTVASYPSIRGTVTDRNGVPLQNIRVTPSPRYDDKDGSEVIALTDEHGNYELPHVPTVREFGAPAQYTLGFNDAADRFIDYVYPETILPVSGPDIVVDVEMKRESSIALPDFSYTSDIVVVGSTAYLAQPERDRILVYDVETGQPLPTISIAGPNGLELSSDGSELVVSLSIGGLTFIDLATGATETLAIAEHANGSADFAEYAPGWFAVVAADDDPTISAERATGTTTIATWLRGSPGVDTAAGVLIGGEGYSSDELHELDPTDPALPALHSLRDAGGAPQARLSDDGSLVWLYNQVRRTNDFTEVAAWDRGGLPRPIPGTGITAFAANGYVDLRSASTFERLHTEPISCDAESGYDIVAEVSQDGQWMVIADGGRLCIESLSDFVTDTDGDGVPDRSDNCPAIANADQADGDGDAIGDVCDPDLEDGPKGDPDRDYLINEIEEQIGTDPLRFDTDGDVLGDGLEVYIGLPPLDPDADDDWLMDGVELIFRLDPLDPDIDDGGALDGWEVYEGTNPRNPADDVVRPRCTINGTNGNDILVGTSGDDVICGRGGNDVLIGGEGSDWLIGIGGRDWLIGGAGDDVLLGGTGADLLQGGKGNDRLYGGRNSDDVRGEFGADYINGGPHADNCSTDASDTVVQCSP